MGACRRKVLPGRLCGQRLLTKYRQTQGPEGERLPPCVVTNAVVGVPVGSKAHDAATDPG